MKRLSFLFLSTLMCRVTKIAYEKMEGKLGICALNNFIQIYPFAECLFLLTSLFVIMYYRNSTFSLLK